MVETLLIHWFVIIFIERWSAFNWFFVYSISPCPDTHAISPKSPGSAKLMSDVNLGPNSDGVPTWMC